MPAKEYYNGGRSTKHVLLRSGVVEFHGELKDARKTLRKLAELVWDCLGSVPVNDEGQIQTPFVVGSEVYPVGTDREIIWHDIEECYDTPIYELMARSK
jgi:hypothetical protein